MKLLASLIQRTSAFPAALPRIGRLTWRRIMSIGLIGLVFSSVWLAGLAPAWAGLTDDNYDGNIFALYAGNGALVPPRVTLEASLKLGKPAIVVFYVDDSRDCKQFATVVSRLEAYYGRVANFIPIMADSVPLNADLPPTDPGYYYQGSVPQTVLFNQAGDVVLNEVGDVAFERVDDEFRKMFDLLPRSESVELKRRLVNEVNTELVEED
jgi:hypothetical protein